MNQVLKSIQTNKSKGIENIPRLSKTREVKKNYKATNYCKKEAKKRNSERPTFNIVILIRKIQK